MRFALLALLVLALAACGGDGDDEAAPTTTAPTTTEAAPETTALEETTTAPPETTTEPPAEPEGPPFQEQPASGNATGPTEGSGISLLADVRLARHEGFDRLVFEFRRGGVPGYRIDWVRPPIQTNPGGATMSVTGEAFLAIRMEPASGFNASGDTTQVYEGPLRLVGDAAGAEVVRDVVRTEDFEAVVTWVAGLAQRAPFRAFALEGPPRIVVDVRTG